MASADVLRVCEVLHESRTLNSPDHQPKPLTPFSITDILSKPSVRRVRACRRLSGSLEQSALSALQELTNNTFRALELRAQHTAAGRAGLAVFVERSGCKKRRKARTAFSSDQLCELEKRFVYQRYLSPADRDQLAQQLSLTRAQVITWFQNRRAKLKRDVDEMKADVESTKTLGDSTSLTDLHMSRDQARGPSRPGAPSQLDHEQQLAHKLRLSPAWSLSDHTSQHSSEEEEEGDEEDDDDEDVEIDVDD